MDKVFVPGLNRIFVYGSNEGGIHGAGAAKTAMQHYGAKWGVGEGLQGNSYAIPTKDRTIYTLPLDKVRGYVDTFKMFAAAHPELRFFVTRIGCGLAGFTDSQIAPLFAGCSANVELPYGWESPGKI